MSSSDLVKKTTKEHYEKYEKMREDLGLGITNEDEFFGISRDELTQLFLNDPYLNNIRLQRWDDMWANYKVYHPRKASGKSLAEGVCVYKHLCIYHFLKAKPEFTNE